MMNSTRGRQQLYFTQNTIGKVTYRKSVVQQQSI